MKFINISKNENESNYHIYFNDDSTETKRTYLKEEDNVEKIKIILNCGFKSLKGLFSEFENNKQIVFIKFKRNDFEDMSYMLYCCVSLNYLDLSHFNTRNITNMSYMSNNCRSLKNIDLSNFNAQKIANLRSMFAGCVLLKDMDMSNFIICISGMFYDC